MRLLADSHILIDLARGVLAGTRLGSVITSRDNVVFASAASFWEIAIKTRIGKLDPGIRLNELPGYFAHIGLSLLAVDHHHAVAELDLEPATRDPFDRLLLAQCQVEDLRLVTRDGALAGHALAWRE